MAQFKRDHNKKLSRLLERIGAIAASTGKEEDFQGIFRLLKIFEKEQGPIGFDNSGKYKIAGAIFLFGIVLAAFALAVPPLKGLLLDYWYIGLGILIILIAVPLIVAAAFACRISSVSEIIFEKNIFFDNRLVERKVHSGGALYRDLAGRFGDFRNRGDERQYISRLIRGENESDDFSFVYDYYVFHYVDVIHVPVTVQTGNTTVTRLEKRTIPRHRYGLILDFKYAKDIAVVSGGGEYQYSDEWKPASQDFNRSFRLLCNDVMAASRFLKPAVVLAFIEADRNFSNLNVEINGEGRMCVSFADDDVLSLDRKHSIAEVEAFEREILGMLRPPRLAAVLRLIRTLKKHNDSGF